VLREQGFFEYEYTGHDVWRWMGPEGRWRVRNTTGEVARVGLGVSLQSVHEARQLEVALDGASVASLHVPIDIAQYELGPWSLAPGDHVLVFASRDRPFRPSDHGGSSDDRALTIAFRAIRWLEGGE
jgi:hypothetical protein